MLGWPIMFALTAVQATAAGKLPERAIRRDIPMTNTIARAFAAGTRDSTGRPGRAYWQFQTDYTIYARIDTATSRLEGRETVVIHNTSPESLTTIDLRLDHNIFRAKVPRGSSIPSETTDGMTLTRLAVNGNVIDPATIWMSDQTLISINLPTPIAPRSKATLDVEWHTKLPGGNGGVGHRMTMRWGDTLYQPTQWYPRVAKYDDLRGWDPERYRGPSEFYNNFGRFDVRIDAPAGWIVSGTGVLQNPEDVLTVTARARLARVPKSDSIVTIVGPDEIGPGQATATGDRLVWHFVADTVNDFAWAMAKRFVWRATRATIPGKGPIPVHMFHLPGHATLFAKAPAATRHALEFYSKLWIPYPFAQLTLQDGPSDGMEYPMVLNSSEGAADHETGHQWWPMMVGTNETRYGWMDEGLNEYMNILSAADSRKVPASFDGLGQNYGPRIGDEDEPPLMWNANSAGSLYGFQTYGKAPMMLSMLGGIVGDSAVVRAMRAYTVAWRFKHPSPWDYMFFMNNALKQDLGWFWYYWLFTTESVDGSIQTVATTGRRTTVTVRQASQMPSPVVLRVKFASTGPAIVPMPNATMIDSVTAVITYPVDVWFAGSRAFAAVLDFGGRKIEKITLDPGRRFPDRDPKDNVWPRD